MPSDETIPADVTARERPGLVRESVTVWLVLRWNFS